MANPEHLEILRQGVEAWNKWREKNLDIEINLCDANFSGIDLSTADLRGADLSYTNFNAATLSNANLNKAYLREADLREAKLKGANFLKTNLREADLSRTDLSGAKLRGADLSGANFSEANLREADLSGTYLSEANLCAADIRGSNLSRAYLRGAKLRGAYLSEANLNEAKLSGAKLFRANLNEANLTRADLGRADFSGANLTRANLNRANLQGIQALSTNFSEAILTGACIEDWNINTKTNLKNIKCDYIFLKSSWSQKERKYIFSERRPHQEDKIFEPGDFEKLVRKLQETVDLIFRNGIDWQAFLNSYEQLKVEAGGNILPIQAIENKGDGTFIIRIQVPPELDKGEIQKSFEEKYQAELKLIEARYKQELQLKGVEIEGYKRENTNINAITQLLASRHIEVNTMANNNSETFHNNQQGSYFANNANIVKDNARQQAKQYNYSSEEKQSLAEAAAEIQALLNQLSETYSDPEEAKQKAAEELATKAKQNPSFKESLKNLGKFVGSKAGETAITESVKQLVPIALALLV